MFMKELRILIRFIDKIGDLNVLLYEIPSFILIAKLIAFIPSLNVIIPFCNFIFSLIRPLPSISYLIVLIEHICFISSDSLIINDRVPFNDLRYDKFKLIFKSFSKIYHL